jgi:hypothetical protein
VLLPPFLRRGPFARPSTSIASRTLALFALGLTLQVTIVAFAPSVRVQERDAAPTLEDLTFATVYTMTARSLANLPVGSEWAPEYEFEFDISNVLTETRIVGRPDPGLELLDVRASQGSLQVIGQYYTLTLNTADIREPVVLSPILRPKTPGFRVHRLGVLFPGFAPSVLTDTLVAQLNPGLFTVHREYPGLARLGTVLTETWTVMPTTVLTQTLTVGATRNGTYEDVVSNRGRCQVGRTLYRCGPTTTGPGFPPQVITETSFAVQPGESQHFLRLSSAAGSLVVPAFTMIELPPTFAVSIDVQPGSSPNTIDSSMSSIPVAILSSARLNAPEHVDHTSLAFGPRGTERGAPQCHAEDANGDARADLVCYFDASGAGFRQGEVTAVLNGRTLSGVPIRGSDSVRVSGR